MAPFSYVPIMHELPAPIHWSKEKYLTGWYGGTSQWSAYYAGNTVSPPPEGTELEVPEIDPTKGATTNRPTASAAQLRNVTAAPARWWR